MVIYNVTVGIDNDIEQEWLQWMKVKHIPDVLATGLFTDNKIFRVMSGDMDNISYSVQYYAESLANVERYLTEFAPKLVEEHNSRYKGKHMAFRTILEQIS